MGLTKQLWIPINLIGLGFRLKSAAYPLVCLSGALDVAVGLLENVGELISCAYVVTEVF